LQEYFPDVFSYFSSGDLFRALTGADNAIGNYVKNRIAAGDLIKDEVTNSLFEAYVHTVLHEEKYMLLDGYPRTVPQMETTFSLLQQYERTMLGIQFVIPDEVAFQRMRGRGRADDTEEAMQHRIQQFYNNTQPVIDWFADHAELIQVDATRSIEEIHEEVITIVSK
jgi:adenylate kinase